MEHVNNFAYMSSTSAAATLPPGAGLSGAVGGGIGVRGLSFSAYGETSAAVGPGRQFSHPPTNLGMSATLPATFQGYPNFDNFEDELMADWTEDQKKEREVILGNRVKLTQYIHDVTVLFPNMKQSSVFTKEDCQMINHEITGTMKVDKFIDILLTKGPKAVGYFHSALETEYPALFEVLSRLFVHAGVNLPPERQLREESDEEAGGVTRVPVEEQALSSCDLHQVSSYLHEIPNIDLIRLGLALGLSYKKLQRQLNNETFLEDMLSMWLRQEDNVIKFSGRPTWGSLVKALRSETVAQNGIAETIEKCHL